MRNTSNSLQCCTMYILIYNRCMLVKILEPSCYFSLTIKLLRMSFKSLKNKQFLLNLIRHNISIFKYTINIINI